MANTQPPARPALFVGSSSEGLELAKAVQSLLAASTDVELWTQGVFGLSHGTLESLVHAVPHFDFAVLVLTADDLTISHGMHHQTARDNVLFELGLFIGGLGRDRTFIIYDEDDSPKLPSDLAGVTTAKFHKHASGNLQASLGAACTKIEQAIKFHKIQITSPTPGGFLEDPQPMADGLSYLVRGKLGRLPSNHTIWLLNQDQFSERVWPQGFSDGRVKYHPQTGEWEGRVYVAPSQVNISIIAVVAPPTSQEFFEYYQKVVGQTKAEPVSRIPAECRNWVRVQAQVA
jgi:Predicted nucleotide-binding protein containing TIR-like domain